VLCILSAVHGIGHIHGCVYCVSCVGCKQHVGFLLLFCDVLIHIHCHSYTLFVKLISADQG